MNKIFLLAIALIAFAFTSCSNQQATQEASNAVTELDAQFAALETELEAFQTRVSSDCESVATVDLNNEVYSLEANQDFLSEEDRARFASNLEVIRQSQEQCTALQANATTTLDEVNAQRTELQGLTNADKTTEELNAEVEAKRANLDAVREQLEGWRTNWTTLAEQQSSAIESAKAYAEQVEAKK